MDPLGLAMALLPSLLLPISFLWDLFSLWRLRIRFWNSQGRKGHAEKVKCRAVQCSAAQCSAVQCSAL